MGLQLTAPAPPIAHHRTPRIIHHMWSYTEGMQIKRTWGDQLRELEHDIDRDGLITRSSITKPRTPGKALTVQHNIRASRYTARKIQQRYSTHPHFDVIVKAERLAWR